MKTIVTATALALALLGAGVAGAADDEEDVARELIESAYQKCDELQKLAAEELDDSILKGTRIEAGVNEAIGKLEEAIDALKEAFEDDDDLDETRAEARAVRSAAKDVEKSVADISRESEIWEKWQSLEDEIEELAEVYELDKD